MPHRTKLIFNSHANRGRAWYIGPVLQAIVARHSDAEWAATEYPSHAVQLAQQAAEEGFDLVAAIGGDGTVHEVVNGLMRIPAERRPSMAIVPVGSGNDFSSSLGISLDLEVAMRRVFEGEEHWIDIGRLTDNTGRTEYWDNTVGIGFDATVTYLTYQITRLKGFSMYLWAVIQAILRHNESAWMKIQTDQEAFEVEALMLVACNGPREGGGFHVAPQAEPADGILDYAMIERVSRLMMFRLLPEVMKGTHARFKAVRMGRFQNMNIHLSRPLPIHTDGEMFAGFQAQVTDLDLELLKHALRLIF
ncbi:MAG: diacylglycerol kinase family lipid kinase [Anaerolineales bacterium]|nr:diacylglycerol kinase family lipid kinase [Anaerolineales bacterium]